MSKDDIREQHNIEKQKRLRKIDLDIARYNDKICSSTNQDLIYKLEDNIRHLQSEKNSLFVYYEEQGCLWCLKIKPWLKKTALFKIISMILSFLGALVQCNIMG